MTAEISEAFLSRDGAAGEQNSFDLIYFSFNETDENLAVTECLSVAPTTYLGMPLRNVRRKQINDSTFELTLNYNVTQNQVATSDPPNSTFNSTLSFNVVGGTVHLTNSRRGKFTTYKQPGNDEVDFNGAIGVEVRGTQGTVRGVDAFAPSLDYSYATQFANAVVDNTYIDDIYSLTGKTNDATFYGRESGSVLFKGAHGTKKGKDRWEISFEFAYSPNEDNIEIGDIEPFSKKGWEYLDIFYAADGSISVNSVTIPLMRPLQVTVHEIYPEDDFSLLKIGVS